MSPDSKATGQARPSTAAANRLNSSQLPNTMNSRRTFLALAGIAALPTQAPARSTPPPAARRVLQVGPTRAITTLAAAARMARDGDSIEVDSGTYVGDVALWKQDGLVLRAVGGRVRLLADGMAAERKGTWVVRGGEVTVEGFDFEGSRVPDRNGAGIRFDQGRLTVRDCRFLRNEVGLQTSNDPRAELTVERCEFAYNKRPDGHNHQLYAGGIRSLMVTGCYFHHGFVGHLLKSRAAVNHVLYNRLTDETGGTASYELEFSNGGVAYVIGNVIQQSATTENPNLIRYGAEGYKWPVNRLFLSHNTLVDNKPRNGIFLRVKPGEVDIVAINNLLVGSGSLQDAGRGDYRNNLNVEWDPFVQASRDDYRLRPGASVLGSAVDAGSAGGESLVPTHEYVHPRNLRPLAGPPRHPGAFQTLGGA